MNQALPALSADAGAIMVWSHNGALKTIDRAGPTVAALPQEIAVTSSSPFGEAARTAQSVWIETHEEVLTGYPESAGTP